MKPTSPHDPLDELLAAAMHGELTAAQRAELDSLLQNDPAARAAYQEIQTMHDLLERNHKDVRPDESFEERMISGVRRKVRAENEHRETPLESALILWRALKWPFVARPSWTFASLGVACIVAALLMIHQGPVVRSVFTTINSQLQLAQSAGDSVAYSTNELAAMSARQNELKQGFDEKRPQHAAAQAPAGSAGIEMDSYNPNSAPRALAALPTAHNEASSEVGGEAPVSTAGPVAATSPTVVDLNGPRAREAQVADNTAGVGGGVPAEAPAATPPMAKPASSLDNDLALADAQAKAPSDSEGFKRRNTGVRTPTNPTYVETSQKGITLSGYVDQSSQIQFAATKDKTQTDQVTAAPAKPAAIDTRKLVRDAKLDLEVKSFQKAVDAVTAQAKTNGGYVDSSNSQRGGNGKLQGTVVVKVLPENLDAFLLKLRDLGEIKNQSVSTEDVTKDYFDTQARLTNSQHMESQLQLLLAHTNGKVSDLLQVERELGRVRGEIEQMQGQLKLYDFQVEYATITINVAEKDLNQAAAYLLEEHDQFSLFVRDVEDAFTQSKAAADTFKAQILNANLQHNSGNSISATLAFSVPPDQIDGFLDRVKSLGRVDNFTRVTQRVANDGGDAAQPSDQARTDKDRVQVQLTIRADDESPRQQTQLAMASTGDIDAQAQQLKDDASKYGATVTASSFEHAPDGTETAAISFRLPLSKVGDFMPVLEKLGRVEALTVQRNDRADQPAADPGAPAEIDLRLHNVAVVSLENETPRQATQLAIVSSGDVDAQAQQLKSDALKSGVTVTASTFERQPDGTEQAALTFRLPMTQAAAFTDTLKKLGRVESFAVQRNDVAGPNSTDPNAPAEISLTLRNEPALVAEDRGFWPTVRHMFGDGAEAFLGSVQVIGVLFAFVLPWVVTIVAAAWVGRRIYVAYRGRRTA